MMQPSNYDATATRFSTVVQAVTDWGTPTPVAEWRARDIVHHLTTWLPELLGSCGVEVPVGALDDPVGSWAVQDAAVRRLLAERAGDEITHAFLGTKTIGDLLAQIYIPDVFMHTWDLARSAGLDDSLDPEICREMVTGMEQMEDVIRGSGQFGPRWAGDPGEDPQRQLVAFIGRDPDWQPQP
jgi:uncharacterized protein (TIGR03086 family)